MKTTISNKDKIRKMTYLAILTALVFVLQLIGGSAIPIGLVTVSVVLLPIVVGAAILGPFAGAWLGLVFAIAVCISNDPTFLTFIDINPFGAVLTVVAKGVLAGFAAGLMYKLCKKVNEYFAVIMAAVICPIVNTGVFLGGCSLFFYDQLLIWAEPWLSKHDSVNMVAYIIFGFCGLNFLLELLFNLVLSPIIVRILNIKKKM